MHEFELEEQRSRAEVAEYLHQLANGLERDNKLTLVVGDESTTFHPPNDVHFRMETSSDSSWLGGDDGQRVVIELGWSPDEVEADDDLTIIDQADETRDRPAQHSESPASDEAREHERQGDEQQSRDQPEHERTAPGQTGRDHS